MKLALRDLFWAVLIAAIGIAWGVEHLRIAKAFANAGRHDARSLLRIPDHQEIARRPQVLAELQTVDEATLVGNTPYNLHEMIRRRMSGKLREMYEHARDHAMRDPNDPTGPTYWDNHQLLTALRRAEGKPDPIQIEIAMGKDTAGYSVPAPLILPRIKNVDADGEPFHIESHGDCRRLWRVQLTDAKGKRVEGVDIDTYDPFDEFGGLGTMGMLPSGKEYDCDCLLNPSSYVKSPRSGRYTLVLVHADSPIANDDDLAGRIYWQSAPVPVIVENLASASKWELIRLPLAILAVVLAGGLASSLRAILRPASSQSKFWLNVRDWFAVGIIALLAVGWSCDIFLMKDRMDQSDLDLQSNWTMRLAK